MNHARTLAIACLASLLIPFAAQPVAADSVLCPRVGIELTGEDNHDGTFTWKITGHSTCIDEANGQLDIEVQPGAIPYSGSCPTGVIICEVPLSDTAPYGSCAYANWTVTDALGTIKASGTFCH